MRKVALFAIFFAFAAISACSPKVITQTRTEYVYRDRVERDTTILHDSTYIREYVKGDTVRIIEYRDRYLYRDRWRERTDTVAVHDTTFVPKEVPAPLTGWQRFRLRAFWWLAAALAVCVAAGVTVWKFRRK